MPRRTTDAQNIPSPSNSNDEPLVRIGFDVPASLRNDFKSKVAKQGKNVRDVLEAYMREYIKQ